MRFRNAVALPLLAITIACKGKPATRDLDVVRVADRGYITNAPIYIAEAEGFFADEGIRLAFIEAQGSTTQMFPILERGDLDVINSTVSSAFYAAIAQGSRIRMVADRGHTQSGHCSYAGIIAHKGLFDAAAPTAASLRGKRISISAAQSSTYTTDLFLASFGLTLRDLHVVRLGESLEVQALDAGNLDLLFANEPYLSRLKAEGHKLIGPDNQYSSGMSSSIFVFGPTLTVENRELGLRFIRAFLKGVKQLQEGMTPRNIEILTARTRIDPALLKSICLPAVYADGHVETSELLKFQQWAVKTKRLDRVLGPDAGVDMWFVQRASKELGIPTASK